jgi:hypothetical protein
VNAFAKYPVVWKLGKDYDENSFQRYSHFTKDMPGCSKKLIYILV